MTNRNSNSKKKQKIPQQQNTKIPLIPFTSKEVYYLSHYQASDELWNRLRVWKASHDYVFIRSLDNLIIKDYAGHNRILSNQEKELKKAYIDWLAIGIESDKFKVLDEVKLMNSTNANTELRHSRKSKAEATEEYHNEDMLTHSGIL